jgi:GAF domain-containing protein
VATPTPTPGIDAPRRRISSRPGIRLSGDELIADLFEAMHELHFAVDALAGADFILALTLEKLPSEVALIHFYDINTREFVVVRNKGAAKLMQWRSGEKEPLIAEAMGRRRAVVISDSNADPRARAGRWALIDGARSLVCAPVEQGGRFLGLLELANPRDGGVYTEGDGHALTYIGEQFAEFLGTRGVILDPERIESR